MPDLPGRHRFRAVGLAGLGWGTRFRFHQLPRRRSARREVWLATWGALLLVYGLYEFVAING